MKILLIGDVVAKLGRQALKEVLPEIIKKEKVEFCVANIENLAHGRGATEETVEEIRKYGVNVMTSGNHIFFREEVFQVLEKDHTVLRPANYPPKTPGVGFSIVKVGTKKVLIINLIGRQWINGPIDDPFRTADFILKEQVKKEEPNIILVDFHAEATSERSALGWYLDGRVTFVGGTHTHIPTADGLILPQGTGYISDIGMTGALESILGVEPSIVISTFMNAGPTKFEWVDDGKKVFRSVLIETKKVRGNKIEITESVKRIDKVL